LRAEPPNLYSDGVTVFDAKPVDEAAERRKKRLVVGVVAALVVLAVLAWVFRYWREERVVNRFFQALEAKDYQTAYGIWMADPEWQQHPQKFTNYPYGEFELDWGPAGEWGEIKKYEIVATGTLKGASGVVVKVRINDRAEPARIWVEKSDRSLTFPPPWVQ
jgi:hypothetical protein